MPEIKDILPELLKNYIEENKENIISSTIDEELTKSKDEINTHKDKVVKEIRKQLRKQQIKSSITVLFISIILFSIGSSIFFYVQNSKIRSIRTEVMEIKTLISQYEKNPQKLTLILEGDSQDDSIANHLEDEFNYINNILNVNGKQLLETQIFRERYYSSETILEEKIENINGELEKTNNLYMTFILIITSTLMLLLAWIFGRIKIK